MHNFRHFDALTFDCYGTLIDWESGILGALGRFRDTHGINAGDDKLLECYARAESHQQRRTYRRYSEILRDVMVDVADGALAYRLDALNHCVRHRTVAKDDAHFGLRLDQRDSRPIWKDVIVVGRQGRVRQTSEYREEQQRNYEPSCRATQSVYKRHFKRTFHVFQQPLPHFPGGIRPHTAVPGAPASPTNDPSEPTPAVFAPPCASQYRNAIVPVILLFSKWHVKQSLLCRPMNQGSFSTARGH